MNYEFNECYAVELDSSKSKGPAEKYELFRSAT